MSAVDTPEAPAEVWCALCDHESLRVVGGEAYCEWHALSADMEAEADHWREHSERALIGGD